MLLFLFFKIKVYDILEYAEMCEIGVLMLDLYKGKEHSAIGGVTQ